MNNQFDGTSARKILQAATADTINLSVSRWFYNKVNIAPSEQPGDNDWAYVKFTPVPIEKSALVELLRAGKAICVADVKNGYRSEANFISSQLIGVDIDGKSVAECLQDDFIRDYAFYVYATPSNLKVTDKNPDGSPRSRALFWLSDAIHDATLYKQYVNRVLARLDKLQPDTVCTQAAQIFFGSNECHDYLDNIDNILPLAVLDTLPRVDSASPDLPTYDNVQDLQAYQLWLEVNSRLIADRLGVTSYGANGYSNKIHCPCGQHNNSDADPSGAWHRDKYHLHCHKTKQNYTIKHVAAFLGIDTISTTAQHRGLHTSTREALLKPKKHSLARFLDAFYMNDNAPGWYTLDELQSAIAGVSFADNTLRYCGLMSNKKLSNLVDTCQRIQTDEGLFFAIFRINNLLDISFVNVENDAKKSIHIPQPPQSTGRGRPKAYYYVPAESDIAALLDIQLTYCDHLTFADLQSNTTYSEALNKALIARRPARYGNDWLGERVGVTARTIRNYTNRDNDIVRTPQHNVLGQVDNVMKIPSAHDNSPSAKHNRGKRFLQVAHKDTGELVRYGYTREWAAYLIKQGHTVSVCVHARNHYQVIEQPDSVQNCDTQQPENTPQTTKQPAQVQPSARPDASPQPANMQHENSSNSIVQHDPLIAEAILLGGVIQTETDTGKDTHHEQIQAQAPATGQEQTAHGT